MQEIVKQCRRFFILQGLINENLKDQIIKPNEVYRRKENRGKNSNKKNLA